eukprot:15874937-Heterocapsa_arctica.AAC.1
MHSWRNFALPWLSMVAVKQMPLLRAPWSTSGMRTISPSGLARSSRVAMTQKGAPPWRGPLVRWSS